MPAYSHIIWDWNGTLFNDVWLCHAISNRLLRERELPELDLPTYRRFFDFPVIRYYERAGFDFERDSFEALSVEFISEYEARRHECQLYENARAVLEMLQEKTTLAILSAYKQDTLNELIAHHDLTRLFAEVQGHHDIYAEGKEASARALISRLGAEAANTLLIGDTLHDLEIARHIGASCILLAHGHQDAERLRATGQAVVESFDELTTLLAADAPR